MSPNTPPSITDDAAQSTDSESGAVTSGRVETDVPPDGAVHRCHYCERPFAEESYLVLHHGLEHADELTEEEREAFRTAYEEEEADLRRFRLVALGLLVALYFGFLFVFAVVT